MSDVIFNVPDNIRLLVTYTETGKTCYVLFAAKQDDLYNFRQGVLFLNRNNGKVKFSALRHATCHMGRGFVTTATVTE